MSDRVADTARQFLAIVIERGWWITPDNRIGLEDAATLLGVKLGTLRNKCAAGDGPPLYRLGGRGHRVSVGLLDLAEWKESRKSLPAMSRNVTQRHRVRAPAGGR
jgi:hypothetical protein